MPYDYRNDPITRPPSARELDWAALVRQKWGTDWAKPAKVYEFSNDRKFDEYLPAHARDAE